VTHVLRPGEAACCHESGWHVAEGVAFFQPYVPCDAESRRLPDRFALRVARDGLEVAPAALLRCRCEPRHRVDQVWRCPAYIRQDNA
jgi:hypothetical protein